MALAAQDKDFILDLVGDNLSKIAEYTDNKYDDYAAVAYPWLRANFVDAWLDVTPAAAVHEITLAMPQQLNADPAKWLSYLTQFVELAQLIRRLLGK